MKRLMIGTLLAVAVIAFSGCKKKETVGTGIDKAIQSADKTSQAAAKDADKSASDLQKKLDGALKK